MRVRALIISGHIVRGVGDFVGEARDGGEDGVDGVLPLSADSAQGREIVDLLLEHLTGHVSIDMNRPCSGGCCRFTMRRITVMRETLGS